MDVHTLWRLPNEEVVSLIKSGYFQNRSGKIRFYAPSFMYYKTPDFHSSPAAFPSISVTGTSCALNCKHCDGKLLNTMLPAPTPAKLIKLCEKLTKSGAIGCLISGGCLPDGSVPLDRFMEAIATIKRSLGLTIVIHTGVTTSTTARNLKIAGVDAALIDVLGSDETITQIYQLNAKVEDYDRSLRNLHEAGIPLVPHVLTGLHYGKLKGELQALEMISNYSPSAVIIIAFMPLRGTPMETTDPPTPEDIAKVLTVAKTILPKTPIVLGCMRPKGEHRVKTDTLAVEAGIDAIAFPAKEACQLAKLKGLDVTYSPLCCSQIYQDITLAQTQLD